MRKLSFLVAFLFSVVAFASPVDLGQSPVAKKLSAVVMNGAAGTRTFTITPGEGFGQVTFWMNYTFASVGNITLTCLGGPFSDEATYTPTVCTGAGTCTTADAGIFVTAVTASKKYSLLMTTTGQRTISCIVEHSAAAAGDIITIKVSFTAK
jgi:hypothetical protein